MCGIFAYIDHKSNYNEEFIRKQFEKGKSRGPESSKMLIKEYKENVIMLGFHRLAINGLNQESNQPLCIKFGIL